MEDLWKRYEAGLGEADLNTSSTLAFFLGPIYGDNCRKFDGLLACGNFQQACCVSLHRVEEKRWPFPGPIWGERNDEEYAVHFALWSLWLCVS